ncbi:MAG: L-threonylcarbamoyladenylate synthase [Bacillales bacterium]|nr:L-threonylcarbamoyladenylate synthase [Bacillales bacterium]
MKTLHTFFGDSKLIENIKKGEVVSFPTETVYGIGVIFNQKSAFDKLVLSKNRTPDKPFTLMLGNVDDIEKYAILSDKTRKIIRKYMPGEITILVKPKEGIYSWVTLNSDYIGIRVPDYKEVREMIDYIGIPLLVTSANISGEPVCKDYNEVCKQFDGVISTIVKGDVKSSLPSTIVLLDDDIKLVREGSIKFEDIKKTWED